MLTLLLLIACGGGSTPAPSAPAPAPAPAAPAPPPPAAVVGPDGPESIAITPIAALPTDPAAIAEGEALFGSKGCGACHKFGEKVVGPDLKGVTARRTVPWLQRMIAEPELMTKQDPVAKEMYRSMMVQMSKQGVSDAEMPNLIAYLKSKEN